MGKKSKKVKEAPSVLFSQVQPGMVVTLKKVDCKVTKVHVIKGKRPPNKFKVYGTAVEGGAETSETKPGARKLPLIDACGIVIAETGKKVVAAVARKEEIDTSMGASVSGAAKTFPIRAGEVKKGSFVNLKGKPCKVISVSISKTGKHGHAKANITGLDVFTNKKYVEISPTSHNMVAPFMFRSEWQLTDINDQDNQITMMDAAGTIREDLNLPKDTKGELTDSSAKLKSAWGSLKDGKAIYVVVLKAMDTEQVIDHIIKDAA